MAVIMTDTEASRFASYIDNLKRCGRKDATLDSYRDAHTSFCQFLSNSERRPGDLTRVSGADLRAWKSDMLKRCRAPSTINHRLITIQAYSAWGLRTGLVLPTQMESIKAVSHVETPALGAVTMNPEEERRFLRCVELSRCRRNQAIIFLLFNGLRISEVAGLHVRDFKMSVNRCILEIRGEHVKRSAYRLVPLTVRARHYLRAYLDESKPSGEVFMGQRGPLGVSGIDKIVRAYAQHTGISLHAHLLRHQFCENYLRENPGDLVGLQNIIGHASIETTSRHYARKRLSDLEASVSKIQT